MRRKIDVFNQNIIIVLLGTSLVNCLNFIYQLIVAHALSAPDFSIFNTLLSMFIIIATPVCTLQLAVAKYCAEFNAHDRVLKIKALLSGLLKWVVLLASGTTIISAIGMLNLMDRLSIISRASGYIISGLLGLSWILPVFMGGLQGLELFQWFVMATTANSLVKLIFAFVFLSTKFNISSALGAFLAADLVSIAVAYWPLRRYISFSRQEEGVSLREVFLYLLPTAATSFCFIALVSMDMVLVKYLFSGQEAGDYALAQMLGKVFLFLPMSIGTVLFPRISGLKAKKMNTLSVLSRSMGYTFLLCLLAAAAYNLFPAFILGLLTGKPFAASILLGRFFSISMAAYALLYVLITYFLSRGDLHFIKYLSVFTFLQALVILVFHGTLVQVQQVICLNAIILLCVHLFLAYRREALLKNEEH